MAYATQASDLSSVRAHAQRLYNRCKTNFYGLSSYHTTLMHFQVDFHPVHVGR